MGEDQLIVLLMDHCLLNDQTRRRLDSDNSDMGVIYDGAGTARSQRE